LSAGSSPLTPLGELTALPQTHSRGPTPKGGGKGGEGRERRGGRGKEGWGGLRKIVHPEKSLRIGPGINLISVRKRSCFVIA